MSAINDGGPAFPHGEVRVIEHAAPPYNEEVVSTNKPGLSILDYFAAKALQGMLADPNFDKPYGEAASIAYGFASAMLAAREAA